MARPLGVIGVPSSAGAYAPGQEHAPQALREAGLLPQLEAAGIAIIDHHDAPVWRWTPDRESPRAQNAAAVADCAAATAARVRVALAAGDWPLVLGGDCTVGVGTVAGHLPGEGRVGLVYLDLHADLNTPDTVVDGALDWMGVAHLLGEQNAVPGLRDFGPRTPLLEDDQLVLLGFDAAQATAGERERVAHRGLAVVPAEAVAADPAGAAATALSLLSACDRLVVHFDVDVIDFTDAPLSENTGRNTGVTQDQAFGALSAVLEDSRVSSLTITELNPHHGAEDGTTLTIFVENLVAALAGVQALAAASARTHG
ncbi:MAG: arginase [Gaiellales bacterium]|nr:arginase [Gaiellales bacterium]